jgi:hypothetical protein
LSSNSQTIVDVVSVGIGFSWGPEESAELAICVTNVCWIEVTVHVEVGYATVPASPIHVRKLAERWKIVGGVKIYTISE